MVIRAATVGHALAATESDCRHGHGDLEVAAFWHRLRHEQVRG
jgi:hypothetical protein